MFFIQTPKTPQFCFGANLLIFATYIYMNKKKYQIVRRINKIAYIRKWFNIIFIIPLKINIHTRFFN